MTDEAAKIHPYQAAGLGIAPFYYVGASREVFRACPGAPEQPGASCDYCGAGLKNVYRVRDARGRVSRLGSSCINRIDPALWRAVLEARREERAAEAARNAAKRRERAAEIERRERPAREAREAALNVQRGYGPGMTNDDVLDWDRIAEETAREMSGHIADGRIDVGATLIRAFSITTEWGDKNCYQFRDSRGNVLVWWTTAALGWYVDDGLGRRRWHRPEEKTELLRLRATVKRRGEYKGQKQTEVLRVKVAPWGKR